MSDLPIPIQALLSGRIKPTNRGISYEAGWKYCPYCRRYIKADGKWCPLCGGKLRMRPKRSGKRRRAKRVDPLKYGIDPEAI